MFSDKWDSENYPSSEDYNEAKKMGTVARNRSFMDKPASGVPDRRRFDGRTSTQTTQDNKKTSKTNTTLTPRNLKLIFVIIMLIAGVLPNLSNVLDQVTDALFPKQQTETTVPTEDAIYDTALPTYLQVTGTSDYFTVDTAATETATLDPVEIENLSNDEKIFILAGMPNKNQPILTLSDAKERFDLIESSHFKTSDEGVEIFNSDGTVKEGSRIEVIFVDMTNDGLKEALVYYTTPSDIHYAEVFYNGGEGISTFSSLDYFELYTDLRITEKGTIQRLNNDGSVYDEIEVTSDGLYLVEE